MIVPKIRAEGHRLFTSDDEKTGEKCLFAFQGAILPKRPPVGLVNLGICTIFARKGRVNCKNGYTRRKQRTLVKKPVYKMYIHLISGVRKSARLQMRTNIGNHSCAQMSDEIKILVQNIFRI